MWRILGLCWNRRLDEDGFFMFIKLLRTTVWYVVFFFKIEGGWVCDGDNWIEDDALDSLSTSARGWSSVVLDLMRALSFLLLPCFCLSSMVILFRLWEQFFIINNQSDLCMQMKRNKLWVHVNLRIMWWIKINTCPQKSRSKRGAFWAIPHKACILRKQNCAHG